MRWSALISLAGCQLVFDLTPPDAIVVEPDGPPVPPKYVFAASQLYTGAIGGLAAADLECDRLANRAGLDGTFLAWLSAGGISPASRMTPSNGPYRLVGETPSRRTGATWWTASSPTRSGSTNSATR